MTTTEPLAAEPPALEVRHLTQEFTVRLRGASRKAIVHAVSDVSLVVNDGETLGIVGETGCGKTTMARSIVLAPRPSSGEVLLRGVDLTRLKGRELREERRKIQMVFQDPFSSLDPKFTVAQSIEEPLLGQHKGDKGARRARVSELLDLVGLEPGRYEDRHPRQLSGGQGQRVAIARALSVTPTLIVCDEPVSSLDVLIQAQILKLLAELQHELGLSYLFISHDLAVVKQVASRVGVMYLGKICEIGPTEEIYRSPFHHYTAALIAANPEIETKGRRRRARSVVEGEPPSPIDPPSGCRFRTRCPRAAELCAHEEPPLRFLNSEHAVACHFPLEASATVVHAS